VTLNPYLFFNGNCEEAFKFYERALDAKIDAMMTHEGTPMADQTPPGWQKKIMHARILVNGIPLMGSDSPPDSYKTPQGFSISIAIKDASEAERVFKALAENGTVQMPLQETFWALRFGMLIDRFGIPWMINCDRPQ
jgi:PhnB protein